MCGRFAFFSPAEAIAATFGLAAEPDVIQRFNVAPGQDLFSVRAEGDVPVADMFRWGLVPFWAKDPAIGNRMINARAETVTEKPSYRQAFRRRRCLIPANGFYEWQKTADGKQPWFISAKDAGLLAFAGLWEEWSGGEGEVMRTCTIITTPANEFMSNLHDRMPVIVPDGMYTDWLAADTHETELQQILVTGSGRELTAWKVSRAVNNPINEEPRLIDRAIA
jgi:putative SOS response-associated peptidase YedK